MLGLVSQEEGILYGSTSAIEKAIAGLQAASKSASGAASIADLQTVAGSTVAFYNEAYAGWRAFADYAGQAWNAGTSTPTTQSRMAQMDSLLKQAKTLRDQVVTFCEGAIRDAAASAGTPAAQQVLAQLDSGALIPGVVPPSQRTVATAPLQVVKAGFPWWILLVVAGAYTYSKRKEWGLVA